MVNFFAQIWRHYQLNCKHEIANIFTFADQFTARTLRRPLPKQKQTRKTLQYFRNVVKGHLGIGFEKTGAMFPFKNCGQHNYKTQCALSIVEKDQYKVKR